MVSNVNEVVLFALPAVSLIARNGEFFGGDFSAGRVLFALAVISTAVGLTLWALSSSVVGRYLFVCYLLLTPGWLALALGDPPDSRPDVRRQVETFFTAQVDVDLDSRRETRAVAVILGGVGQFVSKLSFGCKFG